MAPPRLNMWRSGLQKLRITLPWIGVILFVWSFHFLWVQSGNRVAPPENLILSGRFDTVVIDPGHGGDDEGASGHGLKEKDLSLDLGFKLAADLERQGLKTKMTRRQDVYVPLVDRVTMGNAALHAVFVSLHCNFSPDPMAKGIEVYRCVTKSSSQPAFVTVSSLDFPGEPLDQAEGEFAQNVDEAMVQSLQVDNRGSKQENFFVVRNVYNPALLVECGFLTNPDDAKRLANPTYRDQLAQALASGILRYRSWASGESPKTAGGPSGEVAWNKP